MLQHVTLLSENGLPTFKLSNIKQRVEFSSGDLLLRTFDLNQSDVVDWSCSDTYPSASTTFQYRIQVSFKTEIYGTFSQTGNKKNSSMPMLTMRLISKSHTTRTVFIDPF